MILYDITLPLRPEQPSWPGDEPFCVGINQSIAKGSLFNTTKFSLESHFATHIDAPYHLEQNGLTVENIPLESLIGPVLVHEVDAVDFIRPGHLPDLSNIERIIFKTPNTQFIADTVFHTEFTAISFEAAELLVHAGVKLIGIDYFSVETYHSENYPVHHLLCGNSVILLEGVDLRQISPGWYELLALPMKIQGADGSPVRAILRDL